RRDQKWCWRPRVFPAARHGARSAHSPPAERTQVLAAVEASELADLERAALARLEAA
ncbi:MAG: hypothetical protein HC822_21645, partial [Oscillochloris sp.]|nr:hypothetical protein [Oscillochloris sp.]